MTEHSRAVADVQELYRQGTDVRPHSFDEASARAYFRDYVGFVSGEAPAGGRALDVGCGSGWTSLLLHEAGLDTVGVDLTADAFEVAARDRLTFVAGNAMSLPFPDSTFDVVSGYQMLEHVPDPAQALSEFARVLRPGGVVCVVGPNLVSPFVCARSLVLYVPKNRPLSTILFRNESMPRHPSGNTAPEVIASIVRNTVRLARKLASPEATFTMRTPDTKPPFHSDNDACYLCNPVDLARYFGRRGYNITRVTKPGRTKVAGLFAGGTWFAARKPSGPTP
jgi:SAM-dependent methyltransferase